MRKQAFQISKFLIRWGIAVVGIWWVLSRMSWHDQVLGILSRQTMVPQPLTLVGESAGETDSEYRVKDPRNNKAVITLQAQDVINAPDRNKLPVSEGGKRQYVVGVDLTADLKTARKLLLADTPTSPTAHWVRAGDVPDYHLTIPHPRVQVGVIRMVRQADTTYVLAALAIFPLTLIITSLRWQELLKALDIRIPVARTFVLNMVGQFYSTFMPGSTGGDVLKAYYVAKQTHHRTRAVMSVLVDRVIGLLALIIVGGAMAALQWHIPKCRQVALGSVAILAATAAGLALFYVPLLRRLSGLEFIIARLPMQHQVLKAIETMHIYGRRPLLVAAAIVVTFPVHAVVITAAMLCGFAFNLPIHPFYYWMAVPVIALAGAIPISPQGAGVMEYFAIKLLEPQGVAVAQAFALTMSIRLTQIFWNLSGGIFVFRGGYHSPTPLEQRQIESEDQDEAAKSEIRNPNDESSPKSEVRDTV
ncbi:MAG: lysylphosphatidylglycerol synthase transmembrane domain-containing protein [Tepidisphaeraceae bacterium]|jgi:hypothetical protein